ncbi:endonuclease-reverse transcriptase [Plakobranchus ocellatus]|uniref:Endonuclease-reverse transcriptase n=1 Tax=Plakobranchus ocellatus TaxID=259542 RepID=A0AAV3ZFS0_9GAST|nr:endonuclease-reverse transcriptase [Plakobranchus ocellatus]
MDRKKSNELVLKEANVEGSLIKTIRQRQLQFLGYICRHKGLEHLAITGKIEGKRSRGRQRITFIESLKSWAIGKGSINNFISPQQGVLRLSDPPSGQDASGGARTRDRRVPANLRADSPATVPPTPSY